MIVGLRSVAKAFRPSHRVLFDWLSERVSDPLLEQLAESALEDDADGRKTRELRAFLHEARSPTRFAEFFAFEELTLERWRDPENGSSYGDGTPEACHRVHAFSCACLLLAAAEPDIEERLVSENETLVELVRSVVFLGEDACRHAQGLIAWRLQRGLGESLESPHFGVALLLLGVRAGAETESLQRLCDWVESEIAAIRTNSAELLPTKDGWFFGLSFHNQRDDLWRRLIRATLIDPPKGAVPQQFRGFGERLLQ